jgi:hypothetical protein
MAAMSFATIFKSRNDNPRAFSAISAYSRARRGSVTPVSSKAANQA